MSRREFSTAVVGLALMAALGVLGIFFQTKEAAAGGWPRGGLAGSPGGSFTGGAVTSPITFGDGTAAAPSIAFTSDADGSGTGLFRSGANELAVSTNGVGRWFWSSGHLFPWTGSTYDIGSGSVRVRGTYSDTVYTGTIRDTGGNQQMFYSTVSGSQWTNQAGATVNPMFTISNTNAATGAGRVVTVASGGTTHLTMGPGFGTDTTDSTGSPGAATINKISGKSSIAAGASAVTITNSQVATTSRVLVTPNNSDATCLVGEWTAAAGSGSFVVTARKADGTAVNCTSNAPFDWFVIQ